MRTKILDHDRLSAADKVRTEALVAYGDGMHMEALRRSRGCGFGVFEHGAGSSDEFTPVLAWMSRCRKVFGIYDHCGVAGG